MKNIKRFIALFLCLAMVVGAVGCTTTTTKVITDADIVGSDGRFLYTVVYADGMSDLILDEARNLSSQLRETFDIRVDRGSDTKISEPETEAYEILIGNTDREESKTALEYLNSKRFNSQKDYLIKVMGEKIVIVANDEYVLAQAIRYFTNTYAVGYAEFTPLGEGYEYIHQQEYAVSEATIAGNSLKDYVIVSPAIKSLTWGDKIRVFIENLKADTGIEISSVKHNVAPTDKEIVVGNTNRETGVKVSGNDWIIKVVGAKLVVTGGSDLAIADAMDALIEYAAKCAQNSEPFVLGNDFELKGTYKRDDSNYYFTWGDEFEGKKFNHSVWEDVDVNPKWSNSVFGGKTFRTDGREAYLENGIMQIPGKLTSRIDFQQGQVATNRTMTFQYGIIEMMVKFPAYPMTTALWSLAADYEVIDGVVKPKSRVQQLELDFLENFGEPCNFYSHLMNWFTDEDLNKTPIPSTNWTTGGSKWGIGNQYFFEGKEGETLADAYHLYSVRWTPYELSFAFDGEVYHTIDLLAYSDYRGGQYSRTPIYILIGVSYGDPAYGRVRYPEYKDLPRNSNLSVDYVRLYQSDEYKNENVFWYTPITTGYVPDLSKEEQDANTTFGY